MDASGETRTLTPVRAQALNLLRMPIPPPRRFDLQSCIICFKRGFVKEKDRIAGSQSCRVAGLQSCREQDGRGQIIGMRFCLFNNLGSEIGVLRVISSDSGEIPVTIQ